MYYAKNMQTGKKDRVVYQNGDVFQNKKTGELFQLTMVSRSSYTSDYILCNDSKCLNLFKSSVDIDYNCIGNIAPNLYGCATGLSEEQGKYLAGNLDELEQSIKDLKEATDKVEQLHEQLKEVEECAKARAHHLVNVQSCMYKKIQETREVQ